MPKRLSPIDTWNKVIKSLLETKKAWEEHHEVMDSQPNIEELPIEAQQRLRYGIHRASDFERFMLAFINYWRVSGGLEEMLIPVKDELDELLNESSKGKKNAKKK